MWSGRRALVTGASGGIGRAVAVALAAEGCHVALAGRNEAALHETAALCTAACAGRAPAPGGAPTPTAALAAAPRGDFPLVVADVTDAAADGAFREALVAFGGELDLLANVAGAAGRAELLVELDDAAFAEALALHVLAPARLMRLCHHALARAEGAIVNFGSISGAYAAPRSAPYSAAKAALVALTRATAVEWARDGIRANVVEPGYVATGFNAALIEGGFEERLLAKIPTRRAVSVEAVARTVLFAASNPDMTGAVLRVDGGQTVKL